MMIRDIVVNLPLRIGEDRTIDYAVSLAGMSNAQLTGIAFAYQQMPTGLLGDERWVDGIEQLRQEAEEIAKTASRRFQSAVGKAGVAAETREIATTFEGSAEQFGRIARRFDLSVVEQAEPRTGRSDHLIIQAALFDSGRPVLIVPIDQKNAAKFERIMICWDGSRSAARAVADAFSFLRLAKVIEIITIGDRAKREGLPATDVADHLAAHGLVPGIKQISADDTDVPSRILSHATESAADLVVMGGYGHSRLREFVLGGATRSILAAMSVPTLMSH
jgi:nucleotide-binding universal stress UspA family protein